MLSLRLRSIMTKPAILGSGAALTFTVTTSQTSAGTVGSALYTSEENDEKVTTVVVSRIFLCCAIMRLFEIPLLPVLLVVKRRPSGRLVTGRAVRKNFGYAIGVRVERGGQDICFGFGRRVP